MTQPASPQLVIATDMRNPPGVDHVAKRGDRRDVIDGGGECRGLGQRIPAQQDGPLGQPLAFLARRGAGEEIADRGRAAGRHPSGIARNAVVSWRAPAST